MKRVQMRRGVKLPQNAKSVARPSRWGNPWRIAGHDPRGEPWTREDVLRWYAAYARERVRSTGGQWLEPLRGRDLACYCAPTVRCHADVLLELLA